METIIKTTLIGLFFGTFGTTLGGIIGIKLSTNDVVTDAKVINEDVKEIISISEMGMIKRTSYDNFSVGSRATKGSPIQKLKDKEDCLVSFCPINNQNEATIVSNKSIIKIGVNQIPSLSKGAQGVKAKKVDSTERIIEVFCNDK